MLGEEDAQAIRRRRSSTARAAAAEASPVFANGEVARHLRHALEALDLLARPSARLRMTLLQGLAMHTRTTDPPEFGRAMDELIRLRLPCDRDYLGTLGHLAVAAVQLDAQDHARALHSLLAPYPEHVCVHVSFHPEGSVAHVLGVLASALGQRQQATEHLRAAVALDRAAGLLRCAADTERALHGA